MVSVTATAPALRSGSNATQAPADGLVERARALAPLIRECAPRIEAEKELPRELVTAIAGAGLFRMLVPAVLGGAEADLETMIGAIEEVAKSDGSTGGWWRRRRRLAGTASGWSRRSWPGG